MNVNEAKRKVSEQQRRSEKANKTNLECNIELLLLIWTTQEYAEKRKERDGRKIRNTVHQEQANLFFIFLRKIFIGDLQ